MRWVGFWWKPPGWKSFQYDVVDMSSTQDHLSQQWWNWAKRMAGNFDCKNARKSTAMFPSASPQTTPPTSALQSSPEWSISLLHVKLRQHRRLTTQWHYLIWMHVSYFVKTLTTNCLIKKDFLKINPFAPKMAGLQQLSSFHLGPAVFPTLPVLD